MRRVLRILLPLVFVGIQFGGASAQDLFTPRASGVERLLGIVVAGVPDYEGSDDMVFAAAPLIQYKYPASNRYIQLVGNRLFVNLIDDGHWELGPLGVYRAGREDVEDDVVNLMGDIDASLELGIFLGYTEKFMNNDRNRLNIQFDISQDISDVHEGFVARFSGVYWEPLSRSFDIGLRASVTYASDDYMSTYFDVSARDSSASGLNQFSSGDGIKDMALSIMGLFHLSSSWHVGAGFQYKALFGDASDSPIVDIRGTDNQFLIGVSLLYSW